MMVLSFQQRFVAAIQSGAKRQTVRSRRRRHPLEPGQLVSLRYWSGVPYRSPQTEIGTARLLSVDDVIIDRSNVIVGGAKVISLSEFAIADGFASATDLEAWFAENGDELPFRGILIKWEMVNQ